MKQGNTYKDWIHIPVLKKEILTFLFLPETKNVFDGTLGLGGHAEAVLEKYPNIKKYIATDLDISHIDFAKKRLKKHTNKLNFINKNFSEIKKILQETEITRPLVIFLDLGICSVHVDDATKGFTFEQDTDLSMSFDQKNKTKCIKILNEEEEREIFKIFKNFGEEPYSHKLAKKIIENRKHKPIKTSFDLRNIIEQNIPKKFVKKTLSRIFQSLRIAVNDELFHLQKFLDEVRDIMESGDRLGIISYHSLEDRIVKKFFLSKSRPKTQETEFSLHEEISPAEFKLLTKKPIKPQDAEISENIRSRSAKLRIIEKI